MVDNCREILSNFQFEGEYVQHSHHGNGHINETYYIETTSKRYILQKINKHLFQNIKGLMQNIELVTEHIQQKVAKKGLDTDRYSLKLIKTKDNKTFLYYHDEYYRLYLYIENSIAFQKADNPFIMYQSAIAFGEFVDYLKDFNASLLVDVLPSFHDTSKRFNDLLTAIELDKCQRVKEVQEEIAFYLSRKDYCHRILSLLEEGAIPYKVTHNDTKLNNILFDKTTLLPLAVIDLDTIMKGTILYDFGDAIRFGCSTSLEDEQDLSKVHFDLDLFSSYTKGYLSKAKDSLTQAEIDNLSFSAILMTYECGMRFLEDYLNGDVYFKTTRCKQNLDRTRTQMQLIKEMEMKKEEMERIVKKYSL